MKNVINIFNVLKSVVDSKVSSLNQQVLTADIASAKISQYKNSIKHLQKDIDINMYDRSTVKEDLEYIEQYENLISEHKKEVLQGNFAKRELQSAYKFYDTYRYVVNRPRIKELRRKYNVLESRLSSLEDNMFACEINMDSNQRSESVCEQAERDFAQYEAEYKEVSTRAREILKEIKELEK